MTTPKRTPTNERDEAHGRDDSLRRCFDVEVRADDEDDAARAIEVTASSEALDSHGTIIEQNFDLKRFKRNPVVLFNHNRTAEPWLGAGDTEAALPIARAENVRVEDGQLRARIVFATPEAHPFAERVRLLMKEKILRGVSIGFRRGSKTQVVEEKGEDGQPMMTPHGYPVLRIKKAELVEISVLAIGSNPEAVSRSLDSERTLVRSWTADETHEDDMPAPKTETETNIETLLARANADLGVARQDLETERGRSADLQKRVADLEASAAETTKKLAETEARATKAEAQIVEFEIGALVGRKITPAEKDEQIQLAKDIGLERVKRTLALRPDLPHTQDLTGADPVIGNRTQSTGSGAGLRIVQAATKKNAG